LYFKISQKVIPHKDHEEHKEKPEYFEVAFLCDVVPSCDKLTFYKGSMFKYKRGKNGKTISAK